jgi:hypothetical protein
MNPLLAAEEGAVVIKSPVLSEAPRPVLALVAPKMILPIKTGRSSVMRRVQQAKVFIVPRAYR